MNMDHTNLAILNEVASSLVAFCAQNPLDEARKRVFCDWLTEQDESILAEAIMRSLSNNAIQQLPRKLRARFMPISHCWKGLLGFHGSKLDTLVKISRFHSLIHFLSLQHVPIHDIGLASNLLNQLHLIGLRTTGTNLANGEIDILCNPSTLAKMHFLYIMNSGCDKDVLCKIIGKVCPSNLHELSFFGNPIGEEGARMLARDSGFNNLRYLDLSACRLNANGIAELADSDIIYNISHFAIAANSLHDDTVNPILERFGNLMLKTLDLSFNCITSKAISNFCKNGLPSYLTHFILSNNNLDDESIAAIASDRVASQLLELDLTANHICETGISFLLNRNTSYSLNKLKLAYNNIGDSGVSMLVNSGLYSRLTYLDISYNSISERGIALLAKSQHIPSIEYLDISGNSVTATQALKLNRSKNFRNLQLKYDASSDRCTFIPKCRKAMS